jgi:hypothetical protein
MGRALDNAMLNVEQKDIATSEFRTAKVQPLTQLTVSQRVFLTLVSVWKT